MIRNIWQEVIFVISGAALVCGGFASLEVVVLPEVLSTEDRE